jgi:hypothetical protein
MRAEREADILVPVIAHYKAAGFDVYEEVRPAHLENHAKSSADIVALNATSLQVIEGKKRLTPKAIAQAARWRDYCNRSWVACAKPSLRRRDVRETNLRLVKIAERHGVGVLWVEDDEIERRSTPAKNLRPIVAPFLDAIADLDAIGVRKPAGSPGTPRRQTIDAQCLPLLEYVRDRQDDPPTLIEAFRAVGRDYRPFQARTKTQWIGRVRKTIECDEIPGLRMDDTRTPGVIRYEEPKR